MLTTTSGRAILAVSAFFAAWPAAWALDGSSDDQPPVPPPVFKTAQQALQKGMDGYRSGNMKSSVEAFEYAAAGGNPLARWKLGKMYADGDGVPHDDYKAYRYFSQIIQNYDEEDGDPRDASAVSNAFVAVGIYSLSGIENTEIKADPERAMGMFQYAALSFGDADAQYNLARLYIDGPPGVRKDTRQAVRWLILAAEKGHLQAQALLGDILFNGFDGIANQRARGLMWLTIARDAARRSKDGKDSWITETYEKDAALASDADRQMASLYLDERRKRN